MHLLTAVKIEAVTTEPAIVLPEVELVHPLLISQATVTGRSISASKKAGPKKPGKRLIKQIISRVEAL